MDILMYTYIHYTDNTSHTYACSYIVSALVYLFIHNTPIYDNLAYVLVQKVHKWITYMITCFLYIHTYLILVRINLSYICMFTHTCECFSTSDHTYDNLAYVCIHTSLRINIFVSTSFHCVSTHE